MSLSDIVAVQWGLLGVVGVVITLLIPKATDLMKEFSKYGGDREWKAARRFANTTRLSPVIALGGMLAISITGMVDSALSDDERTRGAWVLWLSPIAALAAFAVIAFRLVDPIPSLEAEQLTVEPTGGRHRSTGQFLDRSILRVVNKSPKTVSLFWIPPEAKDDPQFKGRVDPGFELPLKTYVDHVFEVRRDDETLAVVRAREFPSVLTVTEDLGPVGAPT
jgi:hypothetical protein